MKKRMSAAALGLQLTFWPVMAAIVMCSVLQVLCFFHSDYLWTQESYVNHTAFEWILDQERVGFYGKFGFLMILSMTLIAPRNKAAYTLRRLRISENELTLQWALLFSGYYLISWMVQLLLSMVFFRIFAGATGMDAMDYFLAVYRSSYLRCLLPLGEPWGYVRNVCFCLGWGAMGALVGRYCRHGGKPFMVIALVLVTLFFQPLGMAEQSRDIALCLFTALAVAVQVVLIREVERDEN